MRDHARGGPLYKTTYGWWPNALGLLHDAINWLQARVHVHTRWQVRHCICCNACRLLLLQLRQARQHGGLSLQMQGKGTSISLDWCAHGHHLCTYAVLLLSLLLLIMMRVMQNKGTNEAARMTAQLW